MHGLKKPIQGKIGRARKNLLCSGGSKSQRTAAPSISWGRGGGGGGGGNKRGNKLVSIQLSKPGTISQLYVLKVNVEAHFVCYIPRSPFL